MAVAADPGSNRHQLLLLRSASTPWLPSLSASTSAMSLREDGRVGDQERYTSAQMAPAWTAGHCRRPATTRAARSARDPPGQGDKQASGRISVVQCWRCHRYTVIPGDPGRGHRGLRHVEDLGVRRHPLQASTTGSRSRQLRLSYPGHHDGHRLHQLPRPDQQPDQPKDQRGPADPAGLDNRRWGLHHQPAAAGQQPVGRPARLP